jgi:hypothetical protein
MITADLYTHTVTIRRDHETRAVRPGRGTIGRRGGDGRGTTPAGSRGQVVPQPGQVPRIARRDSRSDPIVASTADGSYPQCAMQFAHRGSLPRP